jgi:hypothetical protein
MPGLYVRSGGTWRNVIAPHVKAGGTWRALVSGWVKSGGTWRQFYPGVDTYSGTATCAYYTDGVSVEYYGAGHPGGGSFSGANDSGGHALASCFDLYVLSVYTVSSFSLSGFGADPGIGHFTTLSVPSGNYTTASAGYSYSAGTATWSWASAAFGMPGSGTASVAMS